MRIQRPTITQITELKGDGASLTGSFSGSFATWDGVTGKPDNIISSSTQLSIVTDVATTISGSVTATSASIAEDIAALTGSFSSSIAGRVTTEEVNVDLVQAHQINLLASTGSNYAHISNLNASTGSNYAHIGNLNASTGSNYAHIANLNAATGSQYSHIGNIHSYTSSLKSAITVSGANTTLLGDLTVTGTRTELQVANLNVEDLNITVASGSATAAAANGAGLTVAGANATLTYASTGDKWVFNKVVDVPTSGLLINATAVTSTAAELNQLDGVTVGGTSAGDIVTIDGSQTLSNKTIAASQVTEISGLTDAEGAQLENIGTTTISAAQWGYLGSTSAFGGSLIDDADASTAKTTLGLENVTNESKATMFSNPTFTGTVSGVTATHVGLGTTADVQFDSLGIGTAAPGTTGVIRATNDIVAYYSSDERLKDNITPLHGALDKVNAMGGYEFDWNDNQEVHEGHDIGVIAQEVQAVYPELVHERDNGYLAVDYVKLTAVLLQAVKELSAKVDELSK